MVVEVSGRDNESQTITLESEDGRLFQISVEAAKGSQHLKHFME
ncbi:Skp1 family, tetramerization domain protein, partial [Gregarina niphandrodes]